LIELDACFTHEDVAHHRLVHIYWHYYMRVRRAEDRLALVLFTCIHFRIFISLNVTVLLIYFRANQHSYLPKLIACKAALPELRVRLISMPVDRRSPTGAVVLIGPDVHKALSLLFIEVEGKD